MNDQQRRKLVARMREELKTIDAEIVRLEEATKPIAPDNAIGRVSRMDAIGNKMINDRGLDSARSRRAQLEAVLDKADSPDFGVCMICMTPIPVERLLAIPESTLLPVNTAVSDPPEKPENLEVARTAGVSTPRSCRACTMPW